MQLKTGVASAHVDSFAARGLPPAELQPAFLFERPELAYPERLNCVTAFVDRHVAEGRGERTAILAPDGTHWTYADLAAEIDRIANVLTGPLGLVPGNRVLLRARTTRPWSRPISRSSRPAASWWPPCRCCAPRSSARSSTGRRLRWPSATTG